MSRTSYYLYAKENTYNSDKKYHRAKHEIREEFLENMKRYGSRWIKVAIIAEKGIELSCKTVAKLMQKQGSKAIQPKSFVPKTTDSSHGKRVAENLLPNQEGHPTFRANKPDQVWVSDIR